ncbi:MAG: hypothetical protein JKP98_18510 [Rhodobacteraceae bacterium]|nr:hypothetical protein [Paracoccaceae bacterium]
MNSTKNKAGARDPEMSSTKKGNDWYFGMKAHVGVDASSGVTPKACPWHDVHSLQTTTAKTTTPGCGRPPARRGNVGLGGVAIGAPLVRATMATAMSARRGRPRSRAPARSGGDAQGPKGGRLDPIEEDINRLIARVRARVEHPFRVIKRQFGYLKSDRPVSPLWRSSA